MRVLIACEFSGVVRDAFLARGHDAVSCDILPTAVSGPHIQGDALAAAHGGEWDLMVAHPPCTYLSVSGARWWKGREREQAEAAAFFRALYDAPVPRVCVENPVGFMSRWRKPDQYVQPWQFGHGETKKTGLWLRGLPKLVSTNVVSGREARIHMMPPTKDRGLLRSITYAGIADAMAAQWG